jgi:SAM-dependent methyltransferase
MDNKENLKILEEIYQDIKLFSPAGTLYQKREKKNNQVIHYIQLINAALSKMSTKKQLVLLDCGCGKSYLSFVLYKYIYEILGRNIYIIGIDNNQTLIDDCNNIKEKLKFTNMEFHTGDIINVNLNRKVNISYSLHACDLATDQTITKGVMEDVDIIFSVSCCQHTNRKKIKCSTLRSVTRYKEYKERIVDMTGDTMRGLLLEALGYRVDIFDFVSTSETPKNMILRAKKNKAKKVVIEDSLLEYKKLSDFFHIRPKLEEYIEEKLKKLENYHLIK